MAKVAKTRSSKDFAVLKRALGFAEGEISDLDSEAWAQLDAELNALFLATK